MLINNDNNHNIYYYYHYYYYYLYCPFGGHATPPLRLLLSTLQNNVFLLLVRIKHMSS